MQRGTVEQETLHDERVHDQLIFFRQFFHTKNRDDILQLCNAATRYCVLPTMSKSHS